MFVGRLLRRQRQKTICYRFWTKIQKIQWTRKNCNVSTIILIKKKRIEDTFNEIAEILVLKTKTKYGQTAVGSWIERQEKKTKIKLKDFLTTRNLNAKCIMLSITQSKKIWQRNARELLLEFMENIYAEKTVGLITKAFVRSVRPSMNAVLNYTGFFCLVVFHMGD